VPCTPASSKYFFSESSWVTLLGVTGKNKDAYGKKQGGNPFFHRNAKLTLKNQLSTIRLQKTVKIVNPGKQAGKVAGKK
jgi:hypothetical protein